MASCSTWGGITKTSLLLPPACSSRPRRSTSRLNCSISSLPGQKRNSSFMQLSLLHLDDALDSQPDFIRACDYAGAQQIRVEEEGSAIRLWGRQQALDDFLHAL